MTDKSAELRAPAPKTIEAGRSGSSGRNGMTKPLRWVGYTPTIPAMLKRVQKLKDNNAYFYMRQLESPSLGHVVVKGRKMIMLGSNNYLG